jgi:plasmid stabilization system protein ParE
LTYRLRFSDQALDDLLSIGSYLKEASASARIADSFVERLIVRCEDLAALPGTLGRDRSELKADMRSMALGNYVIFFRYIDDVLEVVTILEGHRDIDAFFRGE